MHPLKICIDLLEGHSHGLLSDYVRRMILFRSQSKFRTETESFEVVDCCDGHGRFG